jgi:membrane protease YdiL (CAAX protease family)
MPENSFDATTQSEKLIAPTWHTVGLVVLLLGISTVGSAQHSTSGSAKTCSNVKIYLAVILCQWIVVAYVKLGLRSHVSLKDLLGKRWSSTGRIFWDIVTAIIFQVAWVAIEPLLIKLLGSGHWASVSDLLPHGHAEISLWIAMSMTAGFAEELIFRGYLQSQFSRLTGCPAAAVLLQSLLFGFSHGYQGIKSMVLIVVLGALYGVLSILRKSLIPGMLAHASMDIASII